MNMPTGTLDQFHLGLSADGDSCTMLFVDETQRSIRCVADFAEFQAFVANLARVAGEMARRRTENGEDSENVSGAVNVAFGQFQRSPTDNYIEGALVGDKGQIVGLRMCPEVACQLTKAMLMSAPAASSC